MNLSSLLPELQEYTVLIFPLTDFLRFSVVNKHWSQKLRSEKFSFRKVQQDFGSLGLQKFALFQTALDPFTALIETGRYFQILPLDHPRAKLPFALTHNQQEHIGTFRFHSYELYGAIEMQHPVAWKILQHNTALEPLIFAKEKFGIPALQEKLQIKYAQLCIKCQDIEISAEMESINKKFVAWRLSQLQNNVTEKHKTLFEYLRRETSVFTDGHINSEIAKIVTLVAWLRKDLATLKQLRMDDNLDYQILVNYATIDSNWLLQQKIRCDSLFLSEIYMPYFMLEHLFSLLSSPRQRSVLKNPLTKAQLVLLTPLLRNDAIQVNNSDQTYDSDSSIDVETSEEEP